MSIGGWGGKLSARSGLRSQGLLPRSLTVPVSFGLTQWAHLKPLRMLIVWMGEISQIRWEKKPPELNRRE